MGSTQQNGVFDQVTVTLSRPGLQDVELLLLIIYAPLTHYVFWILSSESRWSFARSDYMRSFEKYYKIEVWLPRRRLIILLIINTITIPFTNSSYTPRSSSSSCASTFKVQKDTGPVKGHPTSIHSQRESLRKSAATRTKAFTVPTWLWTLRKCGHQPQLEVYVLFVLVSESHNKHFN